uniref:Uncharacterized protein n=1 Tax=Moniliophthora roreri TaxID=221103 RepID=A0A0W0FDF7_MONRR
MLLEGLGQRVSVTRVGTVGV